ncbi:hypothetical protein [Enterococcus sp. SMC-9]|uniref:hypothetical protein n=1 Tax=Enterococcus sp. SMC-9 TaxID=2862343 RepID=UPI001E4DB475|nr:hypothetical protein [Enterococcus sp. SMC-9]MCD1023485.1 hypothetical protein [Enterococcus sp. SMC-9]
MKNFWYGFFGGIVATSILVVMVFGFSSSYSTLLATWLASIGTIGAVIVSLWLAQNGNKLTWTLTLQNTVEGNHEVILINTGEKPLYLQVFTCRVIDIKKNIEYQGDSPFFGEFGVVHSVLPGNKISMVGLYGGIIDEIRKEYMNKAQDVRIEIGMEILGKTDKLFYINLLGDGVNLELNSKYETVPRG